MTEDLYAYAPCAGLTPLFYSDDEETQEEAKKVCAGCPVQTPCLLAALAAGELFGVWGGMTPVEREQMRQLLDGATEVPAMPCGPKMGSVAGFFTHYRAKAQACPPCERAHLDYKIAARAAS